MGERWAVSDLCRQMWESIDAYATSCRGEPSKHVYGNTPRMKAVAEIQRCVAEHVQRERADERAKIVADGKRAIEERSQRAKHARARAQETGDASYDFEADRHAHDAAVLTNFVDRIERGEHEKEIR